MASMTNSSALTALDAIVDAVDAGAGAGVLRIYAGTIPGTGLVDDALSGNTVLAEITLNDPAFGAATDAGPGAQAVLDVTGGLSDTSANATGTATFARFEDSDSNDVIQVTVGTSGTELIINSASIQSGAEVEITSCTITLPEG